ncbi:MAG: formamidopyrimidine-DNA glycosylase [Chloroflexi bacterium]|nr:MAG: formamidopyrimidine-DNA glycosylase [Chloroflexota bacterium]
MPELPEVETVRTVLDPLLRGRTFRGVSVYWERTVGYPDVSTFLSSVVDQRIVAVERRAKLIVLRLQSGNVLTIHLRMTGELRFCPATTDGETDSRFLRVQLDFTDGSTLQFFDVRKFGRIELLTNQEFDDVSGRLGVEPLDPSFSVAQLETCLLARNRQIKPLLLDQSVVAGLGNIYVDEALFRAGIHPLSNSGSLPAHALATLHTAIRSVLSQAIEHRGTTLRNYRSGVGEPGENQLRLVVYGKPAGSPCAVCGKPLSRTVIGQRGTVYCASCQVRY